MRVLDRSVPDVKSNEIFICTILITETVENKCRLYNCADKQMSLITLCAAAKVVEL